MNIGDLLSQAAEEIYVGDEFEPDIAPVLGNVGKLESSAILLQAAQVIAKEERADADKIFEESANEINRELSTSIRERELEDILLQAAKDVTAHTKVQIDTTFSDEDNEYDDDTHPPAEDDIPKKGTNVKFSDNIDSEEEDDIPEDEDSDIDEEVNEELNSQLIIACYREKVDMVINLLKKGANHFARDRHGWTPLLWSASKGFNEIIEVLLEFRKEELKKPLSKYINARDKITGWTALHVACINGHKHTVELLLANKARKKIKNKLNEYPIDCIGKSKQAGNIKRLLSKENKNDNYNN
eukprot:gene13614-18272_t